MTDPDGNDIFMSGHRGPDLESFCPDSVRVPIFFGPKSVRIGGNPLFCPIIQRLSSGGLRMLVLPLSSSRYYFDLRFVTCPKALRTELISCDCHTKSQFVNLFCDSLTPNLI